MRRFRTGLVIALTTVGVFQVLAPRSAKMCLLDVARAPVLNDMSTDLDDPPAFLVAQRKPLPEQWKARIRAAYPDVQPLTVQLPPSAAGSAPAPGGGAAEGTAASAAPPGAGVLLEAVTAIVGAMPRWQLVKVADGSGGSGAEVGQGVAVVEAVATTALFRFRDDVVVRMRPEGVGRPGVWRVDVRSRSRLGKGDLGANAARIRAFMGKLRQELELRGVEVL